jgi:hypothetical protein
MSFFDFSQSSPLNAATAPTSSPSFQAIATQGGTVLMETDENEAYDLTMLESWPTSPDEAPVSQASNIFNPFAPPFATTNSAINYTTYDIHSEGSMFPAVPTGELSAVPVHQHRLSLTDTPSQLPQLRPRFNRRLSQPAASEPAASQLLASQSPIGQPPASQPPAERAAEQAESSSRRQAHNLVERKYRDTLNHELERLRQAIPHIRDLDAETPDGRPRPSKATVLAAAADYINRLQAEVRNLSEENERLREAGSLSVRRKRGKRGSGG